MPLDEMESFALGIKAGYYGHGGTFTDLTITEAAFGTLITNYTTTRAAYVNGGEAQKGDFLLAKTALMDALDSLAKATDKVAKGNAEIIILAGFTPTKVKGEGEKPGQCVVTVKRGMAGELIATCQPIVGAKHYGCIVTEGGLLPEWFTITADGKIIIDDSKFKPNPNLNANSDPEPRITAIYFDLTSQREKHFTGLKHDATYYFYYYAVNASGVGPVSVPVSMVAW